jgi:hypothetical protein
MSCGRWSSRCCRRLSGGVATPVAGVWMTGADRDPILPGFWGRSRRWCRSRRQQVPRGCRSGDGGWTAPTVLGDGSFDGFCEVAPKVPTVGDLDRFGRPAGDAFGIGPSPVSADDLNTWVGLEPAGQGVSGPVGEDIHWPTGGDIDQDRCVVPAFTQSEIVNAQHPRRDLEIRFGQAADQPDQRHPAHREHQALRQASTGAAAQRQRDRPQRLPGHDSAASHRSV